MQAWRSAALVMIMLYILFRFTKQFSVGAVAALVHDVLITLGVFAVMQWTFDLSVLAAILAVIGYSLNDTIVVSDRIRRTSAGSDAAHRWRSSISRSTRPWAGRWSPR